MNNNPQPRPPEERYGKCDLCGSIPVDEQAHEPECPEHFVEVHQR